MDQASSEIAVVRPSLFREFCRNKLGIVGLLVVIAFIGVAVFAPVVAAYDPYLTRPEMRLKPPSREYMLGNDELGRDLASRLIYGARVSLLFGIVTTSVATVVGTLLGVIAGYFGGALDNTIMRFMDLLLAFPGVLLAIAVVSILGPGLVNSMIAVGIHAVPIFARTVRATTLSVRERDYVMAAKALGLPSYLVIWRHVLPNTIAPVIVLVTMQVGTAILSASTLSFLGLGVTRPTPEWGAILAGGRDYIRSAPHVTLFPGIALSTVVIGFSALGDALRDALDPKLRHV
jgi:peptide/nickel transport system permease protein